MFESFILTWNHVCNKIKTFEPLKKLHNFFSEIKHTWKYLWGKVVAANHSICWFWCNHDVFRRQM